MFLCGYLFVTPQAFSQANPTANAAKQKIAPQDGQHGFDFDFGAWKTHSSRLLHPLTGSKEWVELDGITVVTKVWDGRANLAEYKASGGSNQIELLSLRVYNPDAHQWSLNFATPGVGRLGIPSVGEFKNGRGEFYDQEEINGKFVLVRFSIWPISPDTAQSEQAFSNDGGKTWETNWINKYTRLSDQTEIDWSGSAANAEPSGAHDFDFNLGTWETHIKRILDPFSSSSDSIAVNGTVTVRKVWGGRAQLEEIEAEGPKGHWEALTLFMYDPQAHQWNQSFINSKAGVLSNPLIGSFKEGRGELLANDTFKDRAIFVRGVWSDIAQNSHRYEESYSNDGGKTWHSAFIGNLTRKEQ
ncbi:MAG: hypothetical protein JWO13_360 [Acidobacteriales bacterium]|nr:hypothetical protein [Terriglobales bacterium]